ncbi:GTP 3',8-cyclase MoaA, partial [bacterium]|nr:GTP 3',8-cyclase MoaA [bacterium]
MSSKINDTLDRPLHDLRVSVTDRCSFRCSYCMPQEIFGRDYEFLKREELLNFEEIERLAGIFAGHGVKKIRLTGGEPLLRRDLDKLVGKLAGIPGLELTLTTNGGLLADKAQALKEAGLNRVTVSLDSLDNEIFTSMNGVDFPVEKVLEGIEVAQVAGLTPIKVNMVVRGGVNEQSILPMASHFRGSGIILRFIEYMDVGASNGWCLDDVVPAFEIIKRIDAKMPMKPVESNYRGEVARRWQYRDGSGEIGVIASVTQPFCGDCTRARLSADGFLYTCLFATQGNDLRKLLRGGASDRKISDAVASIWKVRTDRYSEIRSSKTTDLPKVEM